jgi:hypothetical protein
MHSSAEDCAAVVETANTIAAMASHRCRRFMGLPFVWMNERSDRIGNVTGCGDRMAGRGLDATRLLPIPA